SPTTCQLGSSLYSGCQETCYKRTRYQTFYVVSRPSQISCYHSRTSTLCRPSKTTYSGSLGFGSSNSCSLGYGSGSSYLPGCGSSSFRPVACRVHGFPSLNYGSGFCYPSYFTSGNFQSCYRPTCGSGSN
uniref:Keratin-associated protein n=1 Tax=Balaenoptera musculus TaxID=9771 RepID=A0A8C0E1A1_BALMU